MLGEEDNMFKVHVMTSKKQTLALSFYNNYFDVKQKSKLQNSNRVCKRCQNIFIGLKKTCLGVLDRVERDNANETG